MRAPSPPRVLGALTLAYGAAVVAHPAVLTRPAGLERAVASSPRTRAVVRAVGLRDVLSGATMVLLPTGRPLRSAVAARVLCDLGDVVGFGIASPGNSKAKAVAAATGWALLCASSWRAAGGGR